MSSIGLFKKFSSKQIALIIFIDILVTSLVTVLYVYEIIKNETIFLIASTIGIILLMMLVGELSSRAVLKRINKKNSNPKAYSINSFDSIVSTLKSQNPDITKFNFGTNYLFVKGEIAYRICIVENNELYFNRETKEESKANKKLDKCTKFYGFEIFKNPTPEIISKIELFTFQSDKICYSGYYYKPEDNQLIQAFYEPLKEIHQENFDYLLNLLSIVPCIEEEVS